MKQATILFAAAVAASGAFVANADTTTLYSKQQIPENFYSTSEVWTNSVGDVVSWGDYNDGNATAVFNHYGTSVQSFNSSWQFNAYGIGVDILSSTKWVYWEKTSGTPLVIGAGGVDVKDGRFFFSNRDSSKPATVRLAANQTWTGSGASGKEMYFNIGCIPTRYGGVYAKAVAEDGVTSLNITGRLNAGFFGPDNELWNVTVTVSDSAKLWLFDLNDARLNAKKLVLSGDGDRMSFGGVLPVKAWCYPSASAYAPTNVVAMDNFHLAPEVELANGADFTANKGIYAITNLTVSGTGESVISGSLTFTQSVSRVTFANSGAELKFATANAVAGGLSAGFEVVGPGTLKVTDLSPFTGAIDVASGATFECAPSANVAMGAAFSGGGTISVNADGAVVYLPPASIADFTGGIVVESGSLILDEELAEGRVVVNGGTVTYSSTDPLLVTDMIKSEASITVSSGETLSVYGNGLTSATALTLAGGTVKFFTDATVASPVTVTGAGSKFVTDALAVTGTVSGVITASIPGNDETAGLRTYGLGCIRFTGGGNFSGKPNSFRSFEGSAVFDGGEWTFHNCMSLGCDYTAQKNTNPDSTCGKRWTIRNSAVFKIDGYNNNFTTTLAARGHAHNSSYAYESYIDVIDGGTVELGNNAQILAGYYMARGRIRVANGGVVKVKSTSARIILGSSVTAWGILRLEEGGRIELSAPIIRKFRTDNAGWQPQGQFVWDGGTLKINSNFPTAEATLMRLDGTPPSSSDPAVTKGLRIWTRIMGDDCVLDLTDLPARETPLANVAIDNDRAEWFGTGTLTVKGGKPFTMNSFGSGLGLVLEGDGTTVTFPDGAQFHDNAICEARRNVEPGPARYSVFTNLLADVSLKSFTAKGRRVKIVSENATNTLSVASAVAAAGGEFSNNTITFPGGLSVTNLAFASESVIGGNGAFPVLHVEGDITLPSTLLYSAVGGGRMTFTAFEAGGALVGSPSDLTKADAGSSMIPVFDAGAKSVRFTTRGGLLIVW